MPARCTVDRCDIGVTANVSASAEHIGHRSITAAESDIARRLILSSCSFSFARTLKSSSVVVSPLTSPPVAISFSRRRMILPLRVLGSASVKRISSGWASAPISLRDPVDQLLLQRVRSACGPLASVTNAAMPWPFISCGMPTHRGLGDRGVGDQRAFDLHRAQAVAGDVEHVVDAAHDPEVAVARRGGRRRR